jgi:hypothetical protein
LNTSQGRDTDVKDWEEQDEDHEETGDEWSGQNLNAVKQMSIDRSGVAGGVAWPDELRGRLKG